MTPDTLREDCLRLQCRGLKRLFESIDTLLPEVPFGFENRTLAGTGVEGGRHRTERPSSLLLSSALLCQVLVAPPGQQYDGTDAHVKSLLNARTLRIGVHCGLFRVSFRVLLSTSEHNQHISPVSIEIGEIVLIETFEMSARVHLKWFSRRKSSNFVCLAILRLVRIMQVPWCRISGKYSSL